MPPTFLQFGRARHTLFYEHITAPDFDPGHLPFGKLTFQWPHFLCGVENMPTRISQTIADFLQDFISDDTAIGATTVAGTCLDYVTSNYTDNAASTAVYFLTAGTLGTLARVDAEFYAYQLTSDALSAITSGVLICSVVASAPNTQGMTKNDFGTIVQTLYSSVDVAEQARIRDQL